VVCVPLRRILVIEFNGTNTGTKLLRVANGERV
jgi:hypothetical protein